MSARPQTKDASEWKYVRARETLHRMIRDGTYPPGTQLPSEEELPRLLDASRNTIVRALRDLALAGVIVRRHRSGSFVADPRQQPLIPSRFLRLGILLPTSVYPDFRTCKLQRDILFAVLKKWGMDAEPPVFPKVRDNEATRALFTNKPRGCSIEVIGEARAMVEFRPPLQAVRDARLDGILTLSIFDQGWLAKLLDLGVPTVVVDNPSEWFCGRADQAFFDPFPGYRATVRAMIARGLRRIHFVGYWVPDYHGKAALRPDDAKVFSPATARPDPDTFLRKAAWRQAMDEAGIPCPDAWAHITPSSDEILRTLAGQVASLPAGEQPDAVVCHGIEQAEVFLDVFRARGFPLQAAGATSGQHQHTAWPIYADINQLGSMASELLLRRIQLPSAPIMRAGVPMMLPEYMATATASGRPAVARTKRRKNAG